MVDAALRPRPSLAEYAAADFLAWDFWRELRPDGTHGDWIARERHPKAGAEPKELRAPTIPELADMICRLKDATVGEEQATVVPEGKRRPQAPTRPRASGAAHPPTGEHDHSATERT